MPTQSEEEKLSPSPTTEVYERQSFILRNVLGNTSTVQDNLKASKAVSYN